MSNAGKQIKKACTLFVFYFMSGLFVQFSKFHSLDINFPSVIRSGNAINIDKEEIHEFKRLKKPTQSDKPVNTIAQSSFLIIQSFENGIGIVHA